MELPTCLFPAALLLLLLISSFIKLSNSRKPKPPGPRGWPIFGNIFDIKTSSSSSGPTHQTLYSLRPLYGPVLSLRLGAMNTMVVQSAKAAAELFKNHDVHFSDRKVPFTMTAHDFDRGSLAVGRYGPYWRMVRKICFSEFLVHKRVAEMAPLRRKCVDDMIRSLKKAAGEAVVVELPLSLFCMAFNLMGNVTLSRDVVDVAKSEEGLEFFEAMCSVLEWAGRPNFADYFPLVKALDPQGMKRNMAREMGSALQLISRFVKDRDEERAGRLGTAKEKRDLLDVLLDCRDDENKDGDGADHKMTNDNVNILIMEMFFAGTETTGSTTEWAMAELLRRPESLRKAQEEVDRVVGRRGGTVEESHIDQLPYLQAVVKETLRLHPPLPLLIPRNAMEDTNFMGYFVPKGTQVLVNAWAIGRDPDAWEEPLCFKPERFLERPLDYKGQDFEYIPFGSGRRICVGMGLGTKIVPLALASLIHSFDWELPGGLTPEAIDMDETHGISVRKLVPLKVIPKTRKNMPTCQD